jgi:hypothetical protein
MYCWVVRQENLLFENCFALSWEKERDVILNYFRFLCTLPFLVAARCTGESKAECTDFLMMNT